jgi:hypothetical protein
MYKRAEAETTRKATVADHARRSLSLSMRWRWVGRRDDVGAGWTDGIGSISSKKAAGGRCVK